jgi:hypothetical protein
MLSDFRVSAISRWLPLEDVLNDVLFVRDVDGVDLAVRHHHSVRADEPIQAREQLVRAGAIVGIYEHDFGDRLPRQAAERPGAEGE